MRIDLNIVSYNRPQYLTHLLTSLANQVCDGYTIGDVHLFQDGPKLHRFDDDSAQISTCIELFRSAFPDGHVHAAEENIGINGNYRGLWGVMAASESEASIVFEDDLELSPHYLTVMAKLLGHAEENPNVGLVSAVGLLGAPHESQKQRLRALMPMGSFWGVHRWGWGATKEVIRDFMPIKTMYFDLASRLGFADNGEPTANVNAQKLLVKFINDMCSFHGMNHIEIDTMYDVAASATGRINLTTYASFARSIGITGVHFTEQLYTQLGHGNARIMEEVPEDFAWYEPEMMLDVISLSRRYYSNLNMVYNSGTYACEVPYQHLQEAHLIRCLYEQILGWPLTNRDMEAHNLIASTPEGNESRPSDDICAILDRDYDDSYGLLATGHRKKKNYQFPYLG